MFRLHFKGLGHRVHGSSEEMIRAKAKALQQDVVKKKKLFELRQGRLMDHIYIYIYIYFFFHWPPRRGCMPTSWNMYVYVYIHLSIHIYIYIYIYIYAISVCSCILATARMEVPCL